MVKIAQFGEGNFLRNFVDVYFDKLNREEGEKKYSVSVIFPIPSAVKPLFCESGVKYNVAFRGFKEGKEVDTHTRVECIDSVIDPFASAEEYFALARDKELKLIVSNTTEAGIAFDPADKQGDFPHVTYPAKLTAFLYERFLSGAAGVYILPVELVDENGRHLRECVEKYIELWGLSEEFALWNKRENKYLSTLVDRIVSGYPRDAAVREDLMRKVGEKDDLLSVAEPFGLWVIESAKGLCDYIKEGNHNIEVIITDDISYYKKRKVRVLNGAHTTLVAYALLLGCETVYDGMKDQRVLSLMEKAAGEIAPYVGSDMAATVSFYESVKERFFNPFLGHRWESISLNSISKWCARVLPSFRDYYNDKGSVPEGLTMGFGALLALYTLAEREGDDYFVSLPFGRIKLVDDKKNLEALAQGGSIGDFLRRADLLGEDMTAYRGLEEAVLRVAEQIKAAR